MLCGAPETKPLTDTDLVQDIKSEWEQGANTAFVFSKEIKVRASLVLRVVSCRVVSCRVPCRACRAVSCAEREC